MVWLRMIGGYSLLDGRADDFSIFAAPVSILWNLYAKAVFSKMILRSDCIHFLIGATQARLAGCAGNSLKSHFSRRSSAQACKKGWPFHERQDRVNWTNLQDSGSRRSFLRINYYRLPCAIRFDESGRSDAKAGDKTCAGELRSRCK